MNSLLQHSGKSVAVKVMMVILFITLYQIQSIAQKSWEFSVKPGINLPIKEFGDTRLKTGYGSEISVGYHFTNFLSLFSGWCWNHFPAEESFYGPDIDFEETGYAVKIEFKYPTTASTITYTVGIGTIYEHIEAENHLGTVIGDTDHSFGTQAETGLAITIGRSFILKPYGRYKSIESSFNLNTETKQVHLSYLTAGVGLSWTFKNIRDAVIEN